MFLKPASRFLFGLVAVVSAVYAVPVGSTSESALEVRSDLHIASHAARASSLKISWEGTHATLPPEGNIPYQLFTKDVTQSWLQSIFQTAEAQRKFHTVFREPLADMEVSFSGDKPWLDPNGPIDKAGFQVTSPRITLVGHMEIMGFHALQSSNQIAEVFVHTWIGRPHATVPEVYDETSTFALTKNEAGGLTSTRTDK